MAGGPIWAFSQAPGTNGRAYPTIYYGHTNNRPYVGTGVSASLATDCTLTLLYQSSYDDPPSGTLKLLLLGVANAVSGTAQIAVEWNTATATTDYDGLALVNEGTSAIPWAAGGSSAFNPTKVTLNGTSAPSHGEYMVVQLTYDATNWTLAQESVWNACLIWE